MTRFFVVLPERLAIVHLLVTIVPPAEIVPFEQRIEHLDLPQLPAAGCWACLLPE